MTRIGNPEFEILATFRRWLVGAVAFAVVGLGLAGDPSRVSAEEEPPFRLGIIGLDTSHSIAFTKAFNAEQADPALGNCKVVAAYPWGSKTIESSSSRVPGYIEEVKKLGVEIVDSIDDLLGKVDGVLLETNDGGPRREQVMQVFAAGKPVFMDKPVAASLADVVAIYDAAEKLGVPTFSSSSLRYAQGVQEVRAGEFGAVLGCDAHSPCALEPSHTDLYWYGIHGVEMLYTCMGTGCATVSRTSSDAFDLVVGQWTDGRIGTFRGIRSGPAPYGGTAFTEKGTQPIGPYRGYQPLIVEIAKFFRTGQSPVSVEETLELYAFMEAADESKRRGGAPVSIAEVIRRARVQAE
ncbi:MAG: gfo/Idh/MocA family oxidoreductase [Planctomycetaceae bacterium]|nr:MAG: gfo/Idh/MocA family oxidoreductase [Planctomycetaceae bacterium]